MNEEVTKKRAIINKAMTAINPDPLGVTLCDAKIAAGSKCGNCGEHASVAFTWLLTQGVYPIEKCFFPQPYDHAFVLIRVSGRQEFAICDPWANISCPSQHWNEWKSFIFQNNIPPNEAMRVAAEYNQEGSEHVYNKLTSGQVAPDAMDLSL